MNPEIDINDMFDFDNLDGLLKQSGIVISNTDKTSENKVSESEDDNPFNKAEMLKINKEKELDDCVICFNPLYMKLTLPCNHLFCFSCIKGQLVRLSRHQTAKCPLCNRPLSAQLVSQIKKNPKTLQNIVIDNSHKDDRDGYWFYSGRQNGWWAFDITSNESIENLYQKHQKGENISHMNSLSITGMTRIFDFDRMLQVNNYNQSSRKIKRVDKTNIENFRKTQSIKGIAGV